MQHQLDLLSIYYSFWLLGHGLRDVTVVMKIIYLAVKRLNGWVLAFSERASGESAWLLLGLPAAALVVGYGEFWTAIGSALGIFAVGSL